MEAEAAILSEASDDTGKQIRSAEEPSLQKDQKESEIQEDEVTNECDPEDQKDTNMRTKDLLITSQRDKRSISPLSFLKEDFSQFKEEVLKVFRDKDTNPTSQAENKPASSTLDLLKEDLSQLKEDVTSVFSSSKETKSTDPKTSLPAEKTINRLSFLNFKDDLSNIFRISLSKERENKDTTAKEDSCSNVKIKPEKVDEPFFQSLFGKPSPKAENGEVKAKTFPETSEEQLDECNTEADNVQKVNNMKDKVEDSEVDLTVSEEKTESVSETQQSEEVIPTLLTAEQRCEREDRSDDNSVEDEKTGREEEEKQEIEEENPSESPPWEPVSSGITLFSVRDPKKDDSRNQPGEDLWSVKNFACYLTFDPNTANSELHLTDCNRTATRVWSDHQPSDHPDRFQGCPQVLCREGLLDSVYWEVEWSGGADIGVTYNSISRHGDTANSLLGLNERSWSLECSEGSYTPCHRNRRFRSCSPRPFTHRVGVYLNWSAGSLSFYCVSQDAMVHLHTFTSSFFEPLYPGFWVWAYNGSVSLCQVELDWERLLQ
ncbi:E3 ubiquitin-protein ligase TRIM39-like isoform X1 [Plectropomus leopardus]|uniref:E3 ubiquitin-protein ligase TRIM39-like isoform X1 n=1 Tax=Plectropomus leopardus TaxID=160734 RepID=UPI001C4AC199|nr:E3 ubiquitin-protein ligase TRIM39-like isoform X1 [Plectropomus leopardus]